MKKIFCFVLSIILMVMMTGCNMGIGFGKFEFNGIHCADFAGNVRDFTVIKWYDNSNGIEAQTEEAGSLFFSEGTYILYANECPICGAERRGGADG